MEDFRFKTEHPLATNKETMDEFLYEHFYERFSKDAMITTEEGTYVEVLEVDSTLWAVHASGDGDFTSHRIRFELLKE